MNTIGKNTAIAPNGPPVQVQDQKAQSQSGVGKAQNAAAPSSVRETLTNAGVQAPAPQPTTGHQYLDPDQMQEFVARVSEAIRQASTEPYLVGFKPDPDSKSYLIEIRTIDGTLVTSFAPEKVLNLNGNLDDLSGMVIDRKT